MKSIEYCLDRVLQELNKSWDNPNRPPLDSESLLREFEVPLGRHEFFKGLMRMLIEDKYAYPIVLYNSGNPAFSELDHFTKRVMLTPLGFYFIEQGGYAQRKINRDAENIRLGKIERGQRDFRRTQNVLLILVALGTLMAGVYYCVELYWNHGWFHF